VAHNGIRKPLRRRTTLRTNGVGPRAVDVWKNCRPKGKPRATGPTSLQEKQGQLEQTITRGRFIITDHPPKTPESETQLHVLRLRYWLVSPLHLAGVDTHDSLVAIHLTLRPTVDGREHERVLVGPHTHGTLHRRTIQHSTFSRAIRLVLSHHCLSMLSHAATLDSTRPAMLEQRHSIRSGKNPHNSPDVCGSSAITKGKCKGHLHCAARRQELHGSWCRDHPWSCG